MSHVSTANSTASPLTPGSSYTGSAESIIEYDSVSVSGKTDQDGVLYVEMSHEGTNYDISHSYNVFAGRHFSVSIVRTASFFRVRFVNSSSGLQSYLRVQTILHRETPRDVPTTGFQTIAASNTAVRVGPASTAGKLMSFVFSNTASADPAYFKVWVQSGVAPPDPSTDLPAATVYAPPASTVSWSLPGGLTVPASSNSWITCVNAAADTTDVAATGPAHWSCVRT